MEGFKSVHKDLPGQVVIILKNCVVKKRAISFVKMIFLETRSI